jgi:hypothetical protein
MAIQRWLLLAGLLGTAAACKGPVGPLAQCTFAGDKYEYAGTAYQICNPSDVP